MSDFTFHDVALDPNTPSIGQSKLYFKGGSLFSRNDAGVVIDYSALSTQFDTDDIEFPEDRHLNTVGFATVTEIFDAIQSAGLTSGGEITPGTGQSVDVAESFGGIRDTDSESADLFIFRAPQVSTIAVPLDTDIFIGIRYNSGNPEVFTKSGNVWNYNDEFPLGTAVNTGGIVSIIDDPHRMSNLPGKILQRLYETDPFAVDLRTGGFRIADSADGNQNATMTAGALWDRLNRLVIPSIDTSSGDNFSRFFRNGSGGFTEQTALTTWDNAFFDDGSGTLAAVTAALYSIQWVWLDISNGEFLFLYGTAEYTSVADAQSAKVPSDRPEIIDDLGRLLGRFIVQEGVNIASLVESVADFSPSFEDVSNHSNLSGLTNDDHLQYSLVDGTRAFTGPVGGIDPVGIADLATKNYVDINTNKAFSGLMSGILTGGEVTINGGDNTKFDLAAGTGIIIDWITPSTPTFTEVSFSEQLAVSVPGLGANLFTQLFINSSGTLNQQSGTQLNAIQQRQNIVLDSLVHAGMTVIEDISISSFQAYQSSNAIVDYIKALGPINSGNTVANNGANLQIQKVAGSTTFPWINRRLNAQNPSIKTNASIAPVSPFINTFQDGVGGFTFVTGNTVVDTANFDDGSGTLASAASNRFYIKRCFFFGQTERFTLSYGQVAYNSLAEAEAAIFSENPILSSLLNTGTFVTALIHRGNTADLSDAADALFVNITTQSTSGGGAAGTQDLQSTYDLSVDPEIVTDSVRGALTLRRGSAADTDNVQEVQNGAGTTVSSADGLGNATAIQHPTKAEFTVPDAAPLVLDCLNGQKQFYQFIDATPRVVSLPLNGKPGSRIDLRTDSFALCDFDWSAYEKVGGAIPKPSQTAGKKDRWYIETDDGTIYSVRSQLGFTT